jgi:hypothetical protein
VILNHYWTIGVTGNFIGDHNGMQFNNIYYESTPMVSHAVSFNVGILNEGKDILPEVWGAFKGKLYRLKKIK